jgi:hypothetical protein
VRATIPAALQPFLVSYLDQPPAGTCTVAPFHDPTAAGANFPILTFVSKLNSVPIDAGSSFTIMGPRSTVSVTANSADWVLISPIGAFIGSFPDGDYTFAGGPGNDVGAFTAHLTVSPLPAFTSPVSSSASSGVSANGLIVHRRQGMPVAWNSNGATGSVPLALMGYTAQGAGRTVICPVLASAGSFTIPPYALLTLAPTSGTILSFRPGDLQPTASALFSASGLNLGIVQASFMYVTITGFSLQ